MKRKSQAGNDSQRASLSSLSLAQGKRARLWRLLYAHGPANGTLMVLPLDQGLEHGPTDFFPNPAALDTSYQVRLALEGGFSAIALGIGLAEKYMHEHAGEASVDVAVGVLVGIVVGLLGGWLLRRERRVGWAGETFVPIAILGLAALAFTGARELGVNGFVAAFVGGTAPVSIA